jgi:16S rRNA processing protein RimM
VIARTAERDIAVGRIAGVFGVRGELKCAATSAGRATIAPGARLRCVAGEVASDISVTNVRPHKGRLLVSIAGVQDANAAADYVGAILYASRGDMRLSEGEYLDDDLVGCAVFGPNGTPYGSVERVEHYPASDMLVVNGSMVPMVRAIVTEIDLTRKAIVIDPPDGLF